MLTACYGVSFLFTSVECRNMVAVADIFPYILNPYKDFRSFMYTM